MERVLIYPTEPMVNWVRDRNAELKVEARAKFYVALTRAKRSSAIVVDFEDEEEFAGVQKYANAPYQRSCE